MISGCEITYSCDSKCSVGYLKRVCPDVLIIIMSKTQENDRQLKHTNVHCFE